MNTKDPTTPVFKGKYLGVVALVALQMFIGFIHVGFGFWLFSAPSEQLAEITSFGPNIYSLYTVVFGLLTLIFASALWFQKTWGWYGTVTVSAFVIVADTLTLLNLPSIPGIPKFAGFGEIFYSIIVVLYLLQNHVKSVYGI